MLGSIGWVYYLLLLLLLLLLWLLLVHDRRGWLRERDVLTAPADAISDASSAPPSPPARQHHGHAVTCGHAAALSPAPAASTAGRNSGGVGTRL
jgi:hypothetical protein